MNESGLQEIETVGYEQFRTGEYLRTDDGRTLRISMVVSREPEPGTSKFRHKMLVRPAGGRFS